jgi:predicted DNA-binding transcriptional regulator AlpA
MQRRLRYADIERLGIVNNRETLQNWIRKRGFPRGQLTGPNSRTWGEDEVQRWLDGRPTGIKQQLPKPTGRRGRRRKVARESRQEAAQT